MSVPPAPSSAVVDGRPAVGTYAGVVGRTAWEELEALRGTNALWRRARRKRWHWNGVVTPEVFVVAAAVDVGWAGMGFAAVLERKSGTLLFDGAWPAWPGAGAIADTPTPGAKSRFARGRNAVVATVEVGGGVKLEARGNGLEVVATLAQARDGRPGLAAIAEPPGGTANCTHKRTGLAAHGKVTAGGRTFSLDGGFGMTDHSVAVLGRETRWRWAAATSADLGLNVVEGFNGAAENVVWVKGRMLPVGEVTIAFDDQHPTGAWTIKSADGALALTFTPEGMRRQDQDLKLAVSKYVQPFGTFAGTVRVDGQIVEVAGLPGVTEDHLSIW